MRWFFLLFITFNAHSMGDFSPEKLKLMWDRAFRTECSAVKDLKLVDYASGRSLCRYKYSCDPQKMCLSSNLNRCKKLTEDCFRMAETEEAQKQCDTCLLTCKNRSRSSCAKSY